jgi:tetratricopeptide (TPR) repeat protein/SAM-dependent methyltransferase
MGAALDAARSHHRAGRLAPAEALYREVLRDAPQDAEALHLLGMLCFQTGRHDEAAALVAAALHLRDDPEVRHDLGNVLEAKGDLDGAAACYRRTLEQRPGHADAHYNLAGVHDRQGRIDDAIASYRAAIAASPGQADAYNNLGTLLQQQAHAEEALAAYRDAVARAPRVPVYRYNLGNALLALERFDEAIDAYRATLVLAPAHAEARVNLAFALFARANALHDAGRLEEAAMTYGASLAERPDYAPAHNNLGNVLEALGHAPLALASYRRAVTLAPAPMMRANFARALRRHVDRVDDADLRALAARALTQAWARPGELARAAGALLQGHPLIGRFIERGEAGDWAVLAHEPLFAALLTCAPVADAPLERFVAAQRRAMLQASSAPSPEALAVATALARQSFINEYVQDEPQDERARVDALVEAIERDPDGASEWTIATCAAYRPLHTLQAADRLGARDSNPALRELITQQIAEPRRERALRASMPAQTPIADDVSRRVQAQYEENPYPRWVGVPAAEPMPFAAWLRHQLPHARLDDVRMPGSMLVAGCGTGQEAVETAERHPDLRVVAVDLSRSSLAFAQRVSDLRGVTNVTYAQADIAVLASPGRIFDVVSAVGVLHHLADPLAGWRALLDCLAPGGAMQVGLYSARARREIDEARAFVASRGFAPTQAGIRAARAALRADERFARVTAVRDFHTTSETRDLLFHVQETSFTLPQVRDAIDGLGVELLGVAVERPVLHAYRAANPDDVNATDLLRWDAFERAHPDTFAAMYQIWVRKPA